MFFRDKQLCILNWYFWAVSQLEDPTGEVGCSTFSYNKNLEEGFHLEM